MSALDDLVNRHDNHCPCFFRNSRLEFCICNAINAINELTSLHTRIAELEKAVDEMVVFIKYTEAVLACDGEYPSIRSEANELLKKYGGKE